MNSEAEIKSEAEESLIEAALRVLNTADPFQKARLGDSVATRWLQGAITHLLESVIYPEEITHCAAGVRWFKFLCLRAKSSVPRPEILITPQTGAYKLEEDTGEENAEVIQKFHETVREYFRGPLKPPFNEVARKAAGFGPEWYEPLAVKRVN
uniref:Uncharacterized protein n=1 Tax=Kalanchoe fedtschenkoi TaxID=63787 RepID=A0A7N0TLD0_KALFE